MSDTSKHDDAGAAGNAPEAFDGAGDFQAGELIPGTDYVVRKLLGEGGHASAYECENRIGKRVAVKVMHRHLASRADLVARMVVEARRTVQLRHPNIVEVQTAGMTGGDRPRAFIEMELLTGSSGRQLLQMKERLEVPHALDVLVDVCHALDAAHKAGVVHQDLKPDNIFIHLDEWNGKAITKLLDFGVARMLGQGDEGTFEGTLAYAGPEQLRGELVSAATDLYSLGVIAFELITGKRPFEAAEILDETDRSANASSIQVGFFDPTQFTRNLVTAVLEQPPPRLCDFARVPRALEDIVLQLLEKDPAKRPESAKAVANALHAIRLNPSLPKTSVTTQELLVNAAHAPKGGLARAGAPRLATFSVAVGGQDNGEAVDALARTSLATPPPVALKPLTPIPVRMGARTPTPARDARALSPVATDRLPSAPGLEKISFENRVAAGRAAATAGPVGTFEPVVERKRAPSIAPDEVVEERPRQARARAVVLVSVAMAAIVLVLGGVAALRHGGASGAAGPASSITAPSATSPLPPPPPAEQGLPAVATATATAEALPDPAPSASALLQKPAVAEPPAAAQGSAGDEAVKAREPKPRRPPAAKPSSTGHGDPATTHDSKVRPGPGF